jgi:hydrogenase maturation protein HypF
MADNGISGPVIGVAFDGSGYGADGKIWGGEFLMCDFESFERRGHFAYVPLAGGDAATRQPWRSGIAYLDASLHCDWGGLPLPVTRDIPEAKRKIFRSMIERRVNTVDTSSCGRLFDAVSSILGIRHETAYEGQAAIELEDCAAKAVNSYAFSISGGTPFQIAANFHCTLADAAVEACTRVREMDGLGRVCLSGGTFQNLRLLQMTVDGLRKRGFTPFVHRQFPPNDRGLSLGQAVVGDAHLDSM